MNYDLPVIRSITLFVPRSIAWRSIDNPNSFLSQVEKLYDKYMSKLEEFLRENGLTIWTKRLSLPLIYDVWRENSNRVIDGLIDIVPRDTLINIGGTYLDNNASLKFLRDIVEIGLYTGLLWRKTPSPRRIVDIFRKLSMADPVYATRIAVSLKGVPLMTPYYPLSTSLTDKPLIGVALLYPNYILKHLEKNGENLKNIIENVHARIMLLLRKYGIEGFVDHSISPWMADSVARLLEFLSGEKFWRPGIIDGILQINKVLEQVAETHIGVGGFNEVMLPYAEDDYLMRLGKEGLIRARDLLTLSMICVAGPDMLVLPDSPDDLASFVKASLLLGSLTNRTKALRIIVADGEPGDHVVLGKFGSAPILDF